MAATNTPAEAIAIETVCMSTIPDTNQCSLFRFGYNFSAKPKTVSNAREVSLPTFETRTGGDITCTNPSFFFFKSPLGDVPKC